MPYVNIYQCVKCNGDLTFEQKMLSHGRCPLCGYKDPSACTIVKCNESTKEIESVYPVDKISIQPFVFGLAIGLCLVLGFICGVLVT